MLFRVYLSNRLGSEGMGLYQLVLSVYALFATFATAGLTVSVSRICAESLANPDCAQGRINAVKARNTGIRFSMLLGAASLLLMVVMSGFLSKTLLNDTRALTPLRILSISTPFMAAAACYKGWFIASRKVVIPAFGQIAEQSVKIAFTYLFFVLFASLSDDVSLLTLGITAGLSVGEIFSTVYLWICCRVEKKEYLLPQNEKKFFPQRKITSVVLPIAASSYITGLLHTGESLLIPYCFALFGGDRAKALSEFGLIRGMVIPILFFPFSFLQALVSVLIPEISRLNTYRDKTERDAKIKKIMKTTFVFGIAASGIFFFLPAETGNVFYNTSEAAYPLKLLSLVTPFMYVETVADGILKGIGEQLFTLKTGVINSVFRIAALLLFIPRIGSDGYLYLLIISNTFSFLMCFFRLKCKTGIKIGLIRFMLLPLVAVSASGFVCNCVTQSMPSESTYTLITGVAVYLAVFAVTYLPVYFYGNRKAI